MALAALQYYPLPNRQGTATNANNHVGNSASTLDRDIIVARLDHQLAPERPADRRATTSTTAARTRPARTRNPIADPLSDITDVRVQSLTGGAHAHLHADPGQRAARHLPAPQVHRPASRPRHNPAAAHRIDGRQRSGVSRRSRFPATPSLGSAAVSRFQTPILDTAGARLGVVVASARTRSSSAWSFAPAPTTSCATADRPAA